MIALALSALQVLMASPLLRKIAMYLLVAVSVGLAVLAYTKHFEHKAVADYQAQEQVAAAAESARRMDVLNKVQAQADADQRQLAALQLDNEKKQREIARLSAAHDSQPCLDAGSVQRLRAIGRPGN